MGSGEAEIKSAIVFYSLVDIIAGIVTWFLLRDSKAAPVIKKAAHPLSLAA